MPAEYPVKVQVIRARKQAPRFYVNIPLPLAAALDLEPGEEVQWQLLAKTDLRLRRLSSPQKRQKMRGFFSRIKTKNRPLYFTSHTMI